MKASRFYVITGGTMVHVAPHFSLCAPAYGAVGRLITDELEKGITEEAGRRYNPIASERESGVYLVPKEYRDRFPHTHLIRTQLARGGDPATKVEREVFERAGIRFLETNEDLEKLIDYLILQPETKGIVMAAAVCDFRPTELHAMEGGDVSELLTTEFGKREPRLRTAGGDHLLTLTPTDKLLGRIRKARKDIFLVGFKATTGMSEQEQYITGLRLLKNNSCNLVFANDVHEHRNMVITPEEAKYHVTKDRKEAIRGLCEMTAMRSQLHFTRSTVIPGEPISWNSDAIPANLRKVVNHLIARGAYKPFQGKTVGHFATRGPQRGTIYTSRRKTNFNRLPEEGLLRIDTVGEDQVIAHGAKPSVGGQSQRIIFDEHPDVDCIVHAHVPLRSDVPVIPVREQRPYECGSMECGSNTSKGLKPVWKGVTGVLKAVMLDEHGPNICFSKDVDPDYVIKFIETNWDLEGKTGGPVSLEGQ